MYLNRLYQKSLVNAKEKEDLITKCRECGYQYYLKEYKDIYSRKLVKKDNLNLYYTSNGFNRKKYMFFDFEELHLGEMEGDRLIIENVSFVFCNFNYCNFYNIKFKGCSFEGCIFTIIIVQRVIFESCTFSKYITEITTKETYRTSALFDNCFCIDDLFLDCEMYDILYDNTSLIRTRFEKCNLRNSLFKSSGFGDVDIKNCDLCNASIVHTDKMDIYFSDEQKSIVNEYTFIDYKIKDYKSIDNEKDIMEKSKSIKSLSRLYDLNNLNDFGGEYFYQSKIVENKILHGWDKVISTLGFTLCGHGERPLNTLFCILASTIIFAIIYMFTGIDAAGTLIDYSFSSGLPVSFVTVLSDFSKCLFFSVTTFSTVGYGNYVPVGTLSMIISGVHMIIGVSLCALWTGCIFRKIVR